MSETGILRKYTTGNHSQEDQWEGPKSRWEGDVRNGLKKLKLIKWAEQVQDRLKWKDIVEKDKTVPEL
jgi:hypothetical protein